LVKLGEGRAQVPVQAHDLEVLDGADGGGQREVVQDLGGR
jgi:hypothetical protein